MQENVRCRSTTRRLGPYFTMAYWFMGERRNQFLKTLKWHRGDLLEPFDSKTYDIVQDTLHQIELKVIFELFILYMI